MKKDHIIFDNTPGVPPGEFRFNGITRDVQTSVTNGTTVWQPTNGDRIRAMSDEKLSEFLIDFSTKKAVNAVNQAFVTRRGVADWLRQPAGECET